LRHLSGACLDGFHDDVDALIERLFAAGGPIDDLSAWLAFWAPRAAVDAHRRRRGARGALQRPRMTKALAAQLGHDPWLMDLAIQILIWVGVPATAGIDLWPWDEWTQRRAGFTGDALGSTPSVVAVEVERVLQAMRLRPRWYAEHVERPLTCKPAPVAPQPSNAPAIDSGMEETATSQLAGAALDAIEAGLADGQDPGDTILRVLRVLFLGGSGVEDMNRVPGAGKSDEEHLSALLADSVRLADVVDRVLRIVQEDRR
jgi:hypothetical protein